jgi:hypothetical protein
MIETMLRPTIFKTLLTLSLVYLSGALWRVYIISRIGDSFPFGFPFVFWETWGPCRPGDNCASFSWWALIGDIVIWYIISAVILTRGLRYK